MQNIFFSFIEYLEITIGPLEGLIESVIFHSQNEILERKLMHFINLL